MKTEAQNEKALLEMKEMTQKPATSKAIHIGEAINRSLEMAEKDQAGVFGIPSGYPSLDRITKGWGAGELIVIGARPCVGKTTLALLHDSPAVDIAAFAFLYRHPGPCGLAVQGRCLQGTGNRYGFHRGTCLHPCAFAGGNRDTVRCVCR